MRPTHYYNNNIMNTRDIMASVYMYIGAIDVRQVPPVLATISLADTDVLAAGQTSIRRIDHNEILLLIKTRCRCTADRPINRTAVNGIIKI